MDTARILGEVRQELEDMRNYVDVGECTIEMCIRDRYQKYADDAAKEEKVIFGGRLGKYKYYDMHHVVEEALKLSLIHILLKG